MRQCRHCGEQLRTESEQTAARCPRCREPLFERPGAPELVDSAGSPPDRGLCALHPGNLALGACKRCGRFFCPVCRTRWREQILCMTCVQQLMGNMEGQPELRAAHQRQAVLGFILGLGAWLLAGLALLPILAATGRQDRVVAVYFALALLVASLVPAVCGLGQAAAAIRGRGPRLHLATAGLVISSCHVGLFAGMLLLQLGRM